LGWTNSPKTHSKRSTISRAKKPVVRPNDLIRAADLQPERLPLIVAELGRRGWVQAAKDAIQIMPPGEKRAVHLIRRAPPVGTLPGR